MAPKHDDDAVDIAENEQAHANEYEIKDLALAKQAAEDEHSLGFLEAIRLYPKAALWSVLVSASIIMEGYDIILISSFFAQPAFREHYGEQIPSKGSYEITAAWQNGLSNAVSVGTIIGAFANGYFTHRFGYRKVLLVSLASICCFIFISFFSPNLPVLLVGQLLCGIPWGVFATTAPAYASKFAPLHYAAISPSMSISVGLLVSSFQPVFKLGSQRESVNGLTGYRLLFNGCGRSLFSPSCGSHQSRLGTLSAWANMTKLKCRSYASVRLHSAARRSRKWP